MKGSFRCPQSLSIPLAAACVLLPCAANALPAAGYSEGSFSDPQPLHDASNPYYIYSPQYAFRDSAVSWGLPLPLLINDQAFVYADGSGEHFATDEIGNPLQYPDDGLTTVPPGDVWQATSWMSFAGVDNLAIGAPEQFVVGYLTYHNATTLLGTMISSINLDVAVHDRLGVFDSVSGTWPIGIVNSPNTGTPEQNADLIYFPENPEFGSFRVLEDGTATIEVMAQFGSLHLRGFGDVVDGEGYWSPSTAVPEPATYAMIFGVAGLAWAGWRRVSR